MKRLNKIAEFTRALLLFTVPGCSAAWDKLDGTYHGDGGAVMIGSGSAKHDESLNALSLQIRGNQAVLRNNDTGEENTGTLSECEYSDDSTYKCKIEFDSDPALVSGTLAGSYMFTAVKGEKKPGYIFNAILVGNYGSAHAAGVILTMKR